MTRTQRIEHILQQELNPVYLAVENESPNHHVPENSETHFKITAVSSRFDDLSLIARHRVLNQLLKEEFELGLHALSMHLYTPEQWNKNQSVLKSPNCRDGYNE